MESAAHTRNIVVIGASAGGIPALQSLFRYLPASLPASLLVVLHIPPHSPTGLHRILSRVTGLRVLAAEDGIPLEDNTVYVAVPDRHLLVDDNHIRLTRGPKECRARPSVDALFRSAAIQYGPRAIGVILSGALDDGTAGLWAIKDRGGLAFVQDPSEAQHSSMSESAIEHVHVDLIGGIECIAQEIIERCGESVDEQRSNASAQRLVTEIEVATGAQHMAAKIMNFGRVSGYTCPECHGVLVQIEEGSIVRFRCHTGHAFSMKTLLAELNVEIDRDLWDTIRTIEEKVMLMKQAAELAEKAGDPDLAGTYRLIAGAADRRLEPLRELVNDPSLFNGGEIT